MFFLVLLIKLYVLFYSAAYAVVIHSVQQQVVHSRVSIVGSLWQLLCVLSSSRSIVSVIESFLCSLVLLIKLYVLFCSAAYAVVIHSVQQQADHSRVFILCSLLLFLCVLSSSRSTTTSVCP